MTRLKYDFLGRPRSKDASPFAVMSSVIVMWITLNAAIIGAYSFKWSLHLELSVADVCALVFVNVAMWVFSVYATSATRASIREKYMIREHRFYDLEDFCCATFAMPFTICQMARHTADYTRHQAACCTETGLEEGADLPNTGSNVSGSNYFCGDAPPTTEYWRADDVTEEKKNRDIV
jgi:Cys-rich protein (TIGR01571 family)